MTKAKNDVITLGGYLDKSIVNIAAGKVRELVNEGHRPRTALGLATPGSWAEYRDDVKAFLRTGNAVEQPEPRPGASSNGSRKETVKVTKTMFVYLNHAYASDTDLYKHEDVTSDEAEPFYYQGETPVKLWRVEDGPQGILITADANEALAELEAGADSIFPVKVMGQHDEKEAAWIAWDKFDRLNDSYRDYVMAHASPEKSSELTCQILGADAPSPRS